MAITYGAAGQPAQSIFNYDALMATTLAAYRKQLADNISTNNAFFSKLTWEGQTGGKYIAQPLMYALGSTDTYAGYDVLSLNAMNGITQCQFQFARAATPISISGQEERENELNIAPLLKAKITQSEMGMKEFWPKSFLRGSLNGGGSDVREPYTSTSNGSTFVDPLPRLVMYDPTASYEIGGINQSTYSWWRNQTTNGSGWTTSALWIDGMIRMSNNVSKGPGGRSNLILCDQYSWELTNKAYRSVYQNNAPTFNDIPFQNINFWGTPVIWDEFVPDVASNSGAGSTDPLTGTGTMYFLNTQFFKCIYRPSMNFVATPFEKPIAQDAKFSHIMWEGSVIVNNRRKQGVVGNLPRSIT